MVLVKKIFLSVQFTFANRMPFNQICCNMVTYLLKLSQIFFKADLVNTLIKFISIKTVSYRIS